MSKKILLDTNIIVHREANKAYNEDIGKLFKWIDKVKYEKWIHKISIEEIQTYQDTDIVKTMNIKLDSYQHLLIPAPIKDNIQTIINKDKDLNSKNDTLLLNEVYHKRVDFLISEDKGIHRKAKQLGISDKVYKIESFIEKLVAENPDLSDYKVLSVKKEYFGNINLDDCFFDSFKEDYSEFANWFNRKSQEQAYICKDENDGVRAFLFLKVENESENYSNITPILSPKKRLKVGTFKVTSTGYKLGERFLKIIFDNALINKVDEIYVTIFDKRDEQKRLIALMNDWGFELHGTKTTSNGIENVYVRNFIPHIHESLKKCYPFINKNSNVFITPIYPEYHTELMPDSILNNEDPLDFIDNAPHRNALSKVYLSRSITRNLKSGDIILFYRTGGRYQGVISTIGVIENMIDNISTEDNFISECRKRSIFTDEKLKEWWNYKPSSRPFIVNFLYIDSFPTPKINLEKLIELGVISGYDKVPRGFTKISNELFEKFLKAARANESYFVNQT